MFVKAFLLLFLLLSPSVGAQGETAQYRVGRHYDLIVPPLLTHPADKIVVEEFFAYSCQHCYNFEPLVQRWQRGLAADVLFLRSPVVWAAQQEVHARAFYSAQVLGVLDRLHGALFAAIHVNNKRLASAAEVRQVFVANGVAGADFDRAYESFGVDNQLRQAVARLKSARIDGTPALVVAGKYHISARQPGGQADMLKIADFLLEQERSAN